MNKKGLTKTIDNKFLFIKALLKGTLISLSISLLTICIFAFMLRFLDINIGLIKPINQAIKIISQYSGK